MGVTQIVSLSLSLGEMNAPAEFLQEYSQIIKIFRETPTMKATSVFTKL